MRRIANLTTLRTLSWFYLGLLKPGRSNSHPLEAETSAYLTKDNPKLVELRSRYERVPKPGHSCWSCWEARVNLRQFRAENHYLSQAYFLRTLSRYRLSAAYAEMLDEYGWLSSLPEDGKFGAKLWRVDQQFMVTRDLLDSVIELNWLRRHLGWKLSDNIEIIDLGAGYGRFGHRFTHAYPNGRITCLDAIATSTFLCNFYLNYRHCQGCKVLPFDAISELRPGQFSLATNIHSWSEMSLEWIRFWLDCLSDLNVPYLFVVPNFGDLRTKEPDGTSKDFGPELQRHGYKCLAKSRKYERSRIADQFAVFPSDYYLFKRH
jgi:hypothetical protein